MKEMGARRLIVRLTGKLEVPDTQRDGHILHEQTLIPSREEGQAFQPAPFPQIPHRRENHYKGNSSAEAGSVEAKMAQWEALLLRACAV